MHEPKLTRVVTRPGWRHEFYCYGTHYIVKSYTIGWGGKRHYEGSERHEGRAPREDKPTPENAHRLATPDEVSAATEKEIKRRMLGRGFISGPDGALVDTNTGSEGRR